MDLKWLFAFHRSGKSAEISRIFFNCRADLSDFAFRTAAIGLVRLLGESLVKCAAFLGVRRLAAALATRYSAVGPDEASLVRARREQAPALLEMARDLLDLGARAWRDQFIGPGFPARRLGHR